MHILTLRLYKRVDGQQLCKRLTHSVKGAVKVPLFGTSKKLRVIN